eukprot:COSAG05_NODE_668_length_8004_cov_3.894371_1_plen_184_part_00
MVVGRCVRLFVACALLVPVARGHGHTPLCNAPKDCCKSRPDTAGFAAMTACTQAPNANRSVTTACILKAMKDTLGTACLECTVASTADVACSKEFQPGGSVASWLKLRRPNFKCIDAMTAKETVVDKALVDKMEAACRNVVVQPTPQTVVSTLAEENAKASTAVAQAHSVEALLAAVVFLLCS